MVTLDCTASRHDGVTLVTARLRDVDGPTRVRVENRLDGPVWPPRSEGLPEAGWSDNGFEGVVEPGTPALGYASPAAPTETPAALVEAEPAARGQRGEAMADSPAAVVRELGDPSPPADSVPTEMGANGVSAPAQPDGPGTAGGERQPPEPTETPADLPDALGPWMAEMARRVDHAESLAAAGTLPEATAAVRAVGGIDSVRELDDDEQTLRLVARRARRLAERRADAEVPAETLAALA